MLVQARTQGDPGAWHNSAGVQTNHGSSRRYPHAGRSLWDRFHDLPFGPLDRSNHRLDPFRRGNPLCLHVHPHISHHRLSTDRRFGACQQQFRQELLWSCLSVVYVEDV